MKNKSIVFQILIIVILLIKICDSQCMPCNNQQSKVNKPIIPPPNFYQIPSSQLVYSISGGNFSLVKSQKQRDSFNWNSLGYAPAWIQIEFKEQFITQLCINPSMLPNVGKVIYKVIIDGDKFMNFNEIMEVGKVRVIKLNMQCSKIRVQFIESPSWIAVLDIWPRRNGYYG